MPSGQRFHIHGDNIVECERVIDLLVSALRGVAFTLIGPLGSAVCPVYQLTLNGAQAVEFILFPGFSRWDHDILDLVRERGGTLREAADAIICEVSNGSETPILAVEFCGALPAGNQAWQRCGRAYSFGKAQIPYLYVAELGGFELGPNRARVAARLPNPAVPFGYVAFSLYNKTSVLPVFIPSPGISSADRAKFADVFGEPELQQIIASIITGASTSKREATLITKARQFVAIRAGDASAGRTLKPAQWNAAYEALTRSEPLTKFVTSVASLPWAKTAYIDGLTPTAKALMEFASKIAVGLTSRDLPICVVPSAARPALAEAIKRLSSGRVSDDFYKWLGVGDDLTICWVMGFKPKGDDARPDRGLPALARMLIGNKGDLLTVVYGPAPTNTWEVLHHTPGDLRTNGLWEAIFDASDAVLVDSATDGIRHHGYLKAHWHLPPASPQKRLVLVTPIPTRIGEHDVDTALHLLLGRSKTGSVFEGMCNPPGGDWSGLSVRTPDNKTELRWMTLPRVSGPDSKRPDHVFQIFRQKLPPIVLAIESKEQASSIESAIGPRLKRYLSNLFSIPASIERGQGDWSHSTRTLAQNSIALASGIAFSSGGSGAVRDAGARASADITFKFDFTEGGAKCAIEVTPMTPVGGEIADAIKSLALSERGLTLRVV